MLIVKDLIKQYSNTTALNGISFEVKPGRIFGILGPNGAGKTTTIRIILNIIKPTSGSISFKGKLINKNFYNIIGYLPEERGLYRKSKVINIISYFAQLKNIKSSTAVKNAHAWLERIGISKYANSKIEELSKGNQQLIQFIVSVVHNPEILILDEPFSGFDPINQELIRDVISEFLDSGKIVIVSTHLMDIAEKLCSDIFLINNGKEVLSGDMNSIKEKFGTKIYSIDFEGDASFIAKLPYLEILNLTKNKAEVKLKPNADAHSLLFTLISQLKINQFEKVEPSLHNIFMQSIHQNNSIYYERLSA